MLDSRPCGARMTRLSLGLDFRLRGNDEMVVDSRLCGGGNDGSGSCGSCFLAIGCKKGGAENQAQEGYCRLPIADCRLPIADCRLPIADCRLPIADCRLPIADCRLPIADSTATAFAVKLVWLVCVMSFPLYYANGFCHRQMSLYTQKTPFPSFSRLRENAAVCCAAFGGGNYRRQSRRSGLPFSAINRRLRFRA